MAVKRLTVARFLVERNTMSFEKNRHTSKGATAKLILFCGLPGSGKTTMGRKLAKETSAVRFCPDEWMADLGLDFFDEEVRNKLEVRLWKLGQELLRLGQDVILENGLWTRTERDDKRHDAHQLGVQTELHYFDVHLDELLRRLEIRNVSGGHGAVPVSQEQIEGYAKVFQAPDEAELALFDRTIVHKSLATPQE